MIDAARTAAIVRYVEERGGAVPMLLNRCKLHRSLVFDPRGRVPFRKHAEFLEAAAIELNDDLLGMRTAEAAEFRDAGLIAYVALNSPTLAVSIANMRRYLHIHNEGAEFAIAREDEHMALVYHIIDGGALGSRQQTEYAAASVRFIATALVGYPLRPDWVEFPHGPPRNASEAQRLLGAPVRYGSQRTAVIAPWEWRDLPVANADTQLLRLLTDYAEQILAERHRDSDFVDQVQRWIITQLPNGQPSAAAAAHDFGMSVRTLSRRLASQDASFGQILEDVRARLAGRYVRDGTLQLTQVAYLLGYSDQTAFSKAFRHWYGRPPSRMRKQEAQAVA